MMKSYRMQFSFHFSDENADIRINLPDVQKFHCQLVITYEKKVFFILLKLKVNIEICLIGVIVNMFKHIMYSIVKYQQ